MNVVFKKQWKYAPDGNHVEVIEASDEVVELDDEWASRAIASGHAEETKKKAPKKKETEEE